MNIEQAEVLYCPHSYDVEVWYGGECFFKAWMKPAPSKAMTEAENAGDLQRLRQLWSKSRRTLVGLSIFADQDEPVGWQEIVTNCSRLRISDAFDELFCYAKGLAAEIEYAGINRLKPGDTESSVNAEAELLMAA